MAIQKLFKVEIVFYYSVLSVVKKELASTKNLNGAFNWKFSTKTPSAHSQIESYFVKKIDALRFEQEVKRILKKHKVANYINF